MCVATIAAVGVGVLAAGQVAGGIAQGHAASYQAQVARNNAQIAQQNQARAAASAATQTEMAGLKASAKVASTRAGFAANNLDVSGGSPADVIGGEARAGYQDTATVSNNAALAAYGYGTQSQGFQAQGTLDSAEAGWDPIAGAIQGAGTLGSHASDFSSLAGGTPSVPDNYSWMQGDPNQLFGKF